MIQGSDRSISRPMRNTLFFKHVKERELSKDYLIINEIGRGAHGKVSLASHLKSGVKRAVKFISKRKLKEHFGNSDRNSLVDEVRILRDLDHPNILKIFDLYEDDYHYMMVTQ